MNKFMGFVAGAFCGALVGSVAALLYAPMSGKQLQIEAKNRFDNIVSETRYAAQAKQAELQAKLADLVSSGKQPAKVGNASYSHN